MTYFLPRLPKILSNFNLNLSPSYTKEPQAEPCEFRQHNKTPPFPLILR